MFNLLENYRKSELITDDELRRFRLASVDIRSRENRKVSISAPTGDKPHMKIKRRQTGFVRPEDLEKIHVIKNASSDDFIEDEKEEAQPRKVRIATSATDTAQQHTYRRPTGFVRAQDIGDSDIEVGRQSVLTRLYDDVTQEEDNLPTLKDYKPVAEIHQKNILLTFSPTNNLKDEDSSKEIHRKDIRSAEDSNDQVQVKRTPRKVSSDYGKTDDRDQKTANSLRSVEYAKTRPSMTVSQYQTKNQRKDEGKKSGGLRLPGDSPLYGASLSELRLLKAGRKN